MGEKDKEQTAVKKHNLLDDGEGEVDLHELQIKLEKVRSYVQRTEMRIATNETTLQRLRAKQQEVEDKRLGVTLLKKNKTENKV